MGCVFDPMVFQGAVFGNVTDATPPVILADCAEKATVQDKSKRRSRFIIVSL